MRIVKVLAGGVAGAFVLVLSSPVAGAPAQCKRLSEAACGAEPACTWVDAYTRKDGRRVDAYCRKLPQRKSDKRPMKDASRQATEAVSVREG